jgi:misacylated tRNA(Ala) deacylase
MGVPGNPPPPGLAETELFAVDAYRTEFDATVTDVDRDGRRVALARTAFYPVGGGQPSDEGVLQTPTGPLTVTGVRRERLPSGNAVIWHTVDVGDGELPDVGAEVQGTIDWARRHRLMRTHTALHILCGVIWADYGIPVTGGNMEPLKGRLDFPFPEMSADLGAAVERRINEEIAKAHEIVVDFLPRSVADADPALIRTAANLIPLEIDPLRVIDIVGLDRQADGGTHVLSTAEVGAVQVVGTESKGKDNKRIRIAVLDEGTLDD